MPPEHVGRADRGRAVMSGIMRDMLAQRVSDHGLHGFDEVSPRVDGPSLIETDRFIGRVNHGVGWLCELRDVGIAHVSIAVCVIALIPAPLPPLLNLTPCRAM